MKTEFNIILVMTILVSTTLFLIYQNPDDTPKSLSFEKYSNELVQINGLSKKYQIIHDVQKFDESKKLMREKLEYTAKKILGINTSISDTWHSFLLRDGDQVETMTGESFPICNIIENMPVHLQEIQKTEKFQMFAEKYSKYPIELILTDERRYDSSFHYGLIAKSDDGRSALTAFHANSCTNQITDSEKYFLSCHSDEGEIISSINKKDVIASLNHPDFCTIPLDEWRQSVYDYGRTTSEEMGRVKPSVETPNSDYETVTEYQLEPHRWVLLGNIIGMLVSDTDEDDIIEEKIQEYNKAYDRLPDELLQLLEERK